MQLSKCVPLEQCLLFTFVPRMIPGLGIPGVQDEQRGYDRAGGVDASQKRLLVSFVTRPFPSPLRLRIVAHHPPA